MQNKSSRSKELLTQKVDRDFSFYELNIPFSLSLAEKYAGVIKPKRCYDNVVRLLLDTDLVTAHPELRVAYGGVESIEGLFVQHAFFLDTASDKVVDPTLAKSYPEKQSRYLLAVDFSFNEFSDSIARFKSADPETNLDIQKEINRLVSWCFQRGFALIG